MLDINFYDYQSRQKKNRKQVWVKLWLSVAAREYRLMFFDGLSVSVIYGTWPVVTSFQLSFRSP